MFRYKRSIPVSEDKQGYAYYASRLYSQMDRKGREAIHRLCQAAGGEYSEALLEFVTTDATATAICQRHFLSRSTLYRAVRRYYEFFPDPL